MRPLNPLRRELIVDRRDFELVLWVRPPLSAKYRVVKRYGIALGQAGYETPTDMYAINHRSRCPDWMVPDSPWAVDAGLVPGTVIDCEDPANPIKARWLGVTDPKDGVGIHGTADDASIGTAASHGCIRMHVPDVIELYDLVPRWTPIYLGPAPDRSRD